MHRKTCLIPILYHFPKVKKNDKNRYHISESEITTCIKIDKPLVVYRLTRNVMKINDAFNVTHMDLTLSGQKYDSNIFNVI